jgi:hypothetical protein
VQIIERVHANNALLALASQSSDSALQSEVQAIAKYFKSMVSNESATAVYVFDTESDLNDYMTDRHYDDDDYGNGKVALAIVLNEFDTNEDQWDYSVRTNYSTAFETSEKTVRKNDKAMSTVKPDVSPQVACLYGDCDLVYSIPSTSFYSIDLVKPQSAEYIYGYSFSGFLSLQHAMDTYIFARNTNTTVTVNASVSLMATEAFKTDDFQYVISSTLGIFYMLSFLFPVSRMVRALVLEKELKIKEGMKMMGLSNAAYNASWLITLVIQMTSA